MEKVINTLGLLIIACKYAAVLLVAGIAISTGAVAADMLLIGMEGTE
ncbi:hypothetical protein LNL84_04640 [Vibrio sp. ZSDZ34]|jgi:hypothetical protein|uniref:Uncharacterized protein n=1 Tax=Vibrio gelatinilyticus TaxID=2893468 RepID=A0A9X1W9T0_9VIBR|nr:hypothetical protein [Vibrio gelatinilyticus]MCJ2376116.1 hypothetical protein [Vibrio gelatinilyticus]